MDFVTRNVVAGDEPMVRTLAGADLIVATTGHWLTDALLDQLRRDGRLPPVLFGWLEPEAAAAHAVLVDGHGGCLRCGFTAAGIPHLPVTEWPEGGQRDIPACGGAFSAYGPVELAAGAALVADAAIGALLGAREEEAHHIWVGDMRRVAGAAGKVAPAWLETFGDPGRGRFTTQRAWPRQQSCPHCLKKAAAA